jgi:hypothetical protein
MKSTANRSVITPGGSSLMPSHSQGTERRPERREVAAAVEHGVTGDLRKAAEQPSEAVPTPVRKVKTRPRSHVHRHIPAARPAPGDVRAEAPHRLPD